MGEEQSGQPGEQSAQAPERSAEALITKARELLQRADKLGDLLAEGNTDADSLFFDDPNLSLSHRLLTRGEQRTRDEKFTVKFDPADGKRVTIHKQLRAEDGSTKVSQITVAGDLVSGTYANVNDTGKTGPQIKLRPEHIQALVENVYSDLSRALDEREQGSAAVLDANVADLLGLPEQGVGPEAGTQ